MTEPIMASLDPEDAKLVTLARGARGRVNAAEGAAVRDETGRTYSAASITLPSLTLSAIELAVATAISSGARRIDSVVVVRGSAELDDRERRLLSDLGGAVILVCGIDGSVLLRHEVASS